MEFGIQFFPAVGPDQKPADQYWREALELTQLVERLGFTNVRTVEHYFLSYGGYSPDPLIFLSAAAAVTRSIRLITGAVLPVFNNLLKLAGQIGNGGRDLRGPPGGWLRTRLCPTSLLALASRWTRAARASTKDSSRSAVCSRRIRSRRGAASTVSKTRPRCRVRPRSRGRRSGSRRCPPRNRSRTRARSATISWAFPSRVRTWRACSRPIATP